MSQHRVFGIIVSVVLLTGLVGCQNQFKAQKNQSLPEFAVNWNADKADASAEAFAANAQGEVKKTASGFTVNAMQAPRNQTYYFTFDGSKVKANDLAALNVQASYLATHPHVKVRLEGNADNRGSREYNIGLGWRRDQAVARLLEQQGVSPNQIDMLSYGKERPAMLGNSEHAFSLNRRVNLIYEAS